MISLLAYNAAGAKATGSEIAAKVGMVTDPKGEPVTGDVEGFKKAVALLKDGKSVSYQGATGAVTFDQYGDVSSPAIFWRFTDGGVEETRYISLEEMNAFTASLN